LSLASFKKDHMKIARALLAVTTAEILLFSLSLTGCKRETIAKKIPGVLAVENKISLKQ